MRFPALGGAAALLVVPHFLAAQPAAPTAPVRLERVRSLYSAARAYETVAYLDRFVRWPGNAGFDSSIMHIAGQLAAAGYVEQSKAHPDDRLTYRIERYPMATPAWEPLDASVSIIGPSGTRTLVYAFATNRNMLATNSFSTPGGGIGAELVRVGATDATTLDAARVRGKFVLLDAAPGARRGGGLAQLFTEAVSKRGALGVFAYSMPAYTQPAKNRTSIQFTGVPYDSLARGFGMPLSFAAREQLLAALAAGPVRLHVETRTRFTWPATELTVVAEIRGAREPDVRFVYSAHVQEPGTNDNATGVGSLLEAARVAAALVRTGKEDPARTITFLWGQEIRSTARYLQQDSVRARGVRWGMSLDMTGEDTKKTGGTFLIEKMPDPSAVWTRGDDHHTEWGGSAIPEQAVRPHYFNDFVLRRALDEAQGTGWVVRTNPFEGGSDHTPFLQANKPGLLLWHFTDQYYHTDGDRLAMVSAEELRHSGITALTSGLMLASADGATARAIVGEVERAALDRIAVERTISADSISRGGNPAFERHILEAWGDYYRGALAAAEEVEVGGSSAATRAAIADAQARVAQAAAKARTSLKPE
ncbi:MAG: M28 family peptidase [Gemmatimonadetes bacterium]|nr:M28 family peptidase [Gemmatimonadota bacterium]